MSPIENIILVNAGNFKLYSSLFKRKYIFIYITYIFVYEMT